MKRLRILWQLAGQIQEIKVYPNGATKIVFNNNIDLQVNDILSGPINYKKKL